MPGEYLVRLGLSRDVSSPTLPVAIPAEDVTDLVITAPQARQVFGDVVVQGNGPLPRFTLLLMRAEQPSESDPRRTGLATLSERAGERLEKAARGGFAYLVKLSIDPTADGTFNFRLPEGFYRIFLGPQDPIPRAYRLISLTSGAVNLFTDGLKIDATENVWIHVGFATVADDPWVKVSGRVIGLDPVEGVFRVALRSEFTSAIETPINLDGSFEFPRVLRQTEYSVQLVPQKRIASAPAIRVADKDVSNVEIVIPKERDIRGRVTVEGSAPIPVFQLSLGSANPPSTPLTIKMPDGRDLPFLRPSESLSDESNVFHVRPDRDGWFQIKLPEGDYRVGIRGLPNGYALAAMTYGGVNLSGQPLKLAGSGTAELEIALANNPDIHRPEVRGKVRGLSAEHGGTLVRLSSLSSFLTLDAVVNADGAFRFEAVPPDAYLASLSGGGAQLSVTPFLITVPSTGDVNLDFVARQEPRSTETPNDIAPSSVGVTVAELGFTASASANESAAVANLRTLNTAQVTFLSTSGGKYGDIDALVNAGLLDTRFLTTVSGYMFSIINQGGDYLAVGVPAKPNNGQFAFYTTPDGVVRYATADGFAPADEAGKPVQ
jgi:hypothetical protein